MGHFFRECPLLEAAQEFAVTAAPRTRRTRGAGQRPEIANAAVAGLDTRGYTEADLQRHGRVAAAMAANAEDSPLGQLRSDSLLLCGLHAWA